MDSLRYRQLPEHYSAASGLHLQRVAEDPGAAEQGVKFGEREAPSWVWDFQSCLAVGVDSDAASGAEQTGATSTDLAGMSSAAAVAIDAEDVVHMGMEQLAEVA